ncbi:MAG TPA: DNA ligase D [Blastocatellia bacterium]|nr:DNA ligase D [Blastocatellia bacterium]
MSSLSAYRRKRRFKDTPEPEARDKPKHSGRSFVVQKHDATRLHYDFRLEIDGVLKSWAVPKGPSLNPTDKRLAMETEDHPIEYGSFEGVIPEGNYGAGPVVLRDRGTFESGGSAPASQQYRQGELKFILRGEKLRGGFVLVRLRNPAAKGKPWLLIKHRDAEADPDWKIEAHDGSVRTGRNLKQVEGELAASKPTGHPAPGRLSGARRAAMPQALHPMLATLVDKPFSDPDWLFEIKWDGVRALAWVRKGRLEARSRTGRAIMRQYPELAGLPERLHAETAILDGEIVVLEEDGRSNFERLQARINVESPTESVRSRSPIVYMIFDILYCDGYDLRHVALSERKLLLRNVLQSGGRFLYTDHQAEKGEELAEAAREQRLEGIVGKRVSSFYVERRSSDWVKFKLTHEMDAVVGGYTAPRGSREHFGALLLGLYAGNALRFTGGVGTGFDQRMQKAVYPKLAELQVSRCPFEQVPETREKATWVRPTLVARVRYSNWTKDNRLRAPVFLSLLNDREAKDCQFKTETPVPVSDALGKSKNSMRRAGLKKKKGGKSSVRSGQPVSSGSAIEKELFEGRPEEVSLKLGGKDLRLTNLNKVYFPKEGYTKRNLIAYYYKIAKFILPFLKDRPLVLRRYPEGIAGESFFQKEAGDSIPDWMETAIVHSEGKQGDMRYFVANDLASLLYLTNLGCIDHNPWSSRRDDLEHPDYVFFDLDPSDGTHFATVMQVARAVHAKLVKLGLKVFLKTSGATGFHMYVPLRRGYTFEQVRLFAEIMGRLVAKEMPKQVTEERIIAKRRTGTVMIDAYQNSSGRPLAAPYSARAFPGAPVSAPVSARELQQELKPGQFTINTIFKRLNRIGDLWAGFWSAPQSLEEPLKRLEGR